MAPASKRRKLVASHKEDSEGENDWQSDELSSLPGSDEEDEEEFDDDDDEEDEEDSEYGSDEDAREDEPAKPTSSNVQIVIPTSAPIEKRKRGRPKKDPADKPPKIPKKRGRPRKYAVGEEPKYRRSRRKLNPDGSFKKRGRPKKVIKPEDIVPKIPKKRGRPRKNPLAEGEASKSGKRRRKKEFDLLAGLDLDFEDDYNDSIDGGADADEGDEHEARDHGKTAEDDILAKLRRRILYRQHDAELQDFVDNIVPVPKPTAQPADPPASELSTQIDAAPRSGLPVLPKRTISTATEVPSSEKRKERQPFESSRNENSMTDSVQDMADMSTTSLTKFKGRPPGTKNKPPEWQNNPLFRASRGATTITSHPETAEHSEDEGDRNTAALVARDSSSAVSKATVARADGMSKLVRPTSSDAYFLFNTSKKARGAAGLAIGTSTNLISAKLGALQPSSLEGVVQEQTRPGTIAHMAFHLYRRLLPVYTAQLLAGYSIVFHGVGSKVDLLTELVHNRIQSHGDAVGIVAQGAIKAFKVEDMLSQIESAVELGPLSSTTTHQQQEQEQVSTHVASTLTVSRAHRIAAYFGLQQQQHRRERKATGPSRLFLILETFDAPGMQNARFRTVLDILGACSGVHIMATVEHVNSGLVIGSHHGAALDATMEDSNEQKSSKRLTWIWQNISTFAPSLNEMLIMRSNTAFSSWMPALPSSLDLLGSTGRLHTRGAGAAGGAGEGASVSLFNGLAVSESIINISDQSAISILKSVTTKARALFNLVAKQILASASTELAGTTQEGLAYADLLTKAKRGFLVSNEADFKSLLVEFLDHQLLQITRLGNIRIGLENHQVLRDVMERMKTL